MLHQLCSLEGMGMLDPVQNILRREFRIWESEIKDDACFSNLVGRKSIKGHTITCRFFFSSCEQSWLIASSVFSILSSSLVSGRYTSRFALETSTPTNIFAFFALEIIKSQPTKFELARGSSCDGSVNTKRCQEPLQHAKRCHYNTKRCQEPLLTF